MQIIIILVTLLDLLMNFRQVLLAFNADTCLTCAHVCMHFNLFLHKSYF